VSPTLPGVTRRLFLALWPTPAERHALQLASAVAAGACRAVPASNLHVTLAFLGAVPETRIAELVALAGHLAAQAAASPLHFTRLEHWRHPRILAAVPAEASPAAAHLAAELKRLTAAGGFRPDLKPFRAHVTVARQVDAGTGAALELPAVSWRGARLALAESRGGPEGLLYSVLDSWLLGKRENMRRES
jgi:RNA 2',3'-cyclic 3'-phosphodiesterase